MSEVAIEIAGVSKKFRRGEVHDSLRDLLPAMSKSLFKRLAGTGNLGASEFWALRDVGLKVSYGETVGIIGHNGAGKSTLLKHLTGVLRPTVGSIRLNGRVSALIEIGAGFHPDLTGRENVFLNGVILGMSLAEVRRKFDMIVAFSGLEAFIDTPVKRYSSGMFARLGFSVAAHLDPEILLIDEVLSVGDYMFQQKGLAKMSEIAAGGATVIFVSHNLRSIKELCSRTILLDHGRVIYDGDTSAAVEQYETVGIARQGEEAGIETLVFSLSGGDGQGSPFQAGDRAWLDCKVRIKKPVKRADIQFVIQSEDGVEVTRFSVAGIQGGEPFVVDGSTTLGYRIGLQLHLAPGHYRLRSAVQDRSRELRSAAIGPEIRFVITGQAGLRGPANVYPDLVTADQQPTPGD